MINHSVRGFLFSAILFILIAPVLLRAADFIMEIVVR
jgi:hypothetical protein